MGLSLSTDGYLRIRSGPLRDQYAHRAYAERQLGRPLKPNEVVDHLCHNRTCWPPSDFHLCIMEKALHDAAHARANGIATHRPRPSRDKQLTDWKKFIFGSSS